MSDMSSETLALADECREFVGHSITPSSGCRCISHNASIKGKEGSFHVKSMAMDLPVDDPKKLYLYLCKKYPRKYGFGLYKTFVHIDTRKISARW